MCPSGKVYNPLTGKSGETCGVEGSVGVIGAGSGAAGVTVDGGTVACGAGVTGGAGTAGGAGTTGSADTAGVVGAAGASTFTSCTGVIATGASGRGRATSGWLSCAEGLCSETGAASASSSGAAGSWTKLLVSSAAVVNELLATGVDGAQAASVSARVSVARVAYLACPDRRYFILGSFPHGVIEQFLCSYLLFPAGGP